MLEVKRKEKLIKHPFRVRLLLQHMLAFILLDTPSLEPLAAETKSKIRGYLFSECISDVRLPTCRFRSESGRSSPFFASLFLTRQLDALIDEYPDYGGWFITAAFGPPPYLESSPANPQSRESRLPF